MKLTHRRVNMAWTVHLVCFLLTVSLTPAGCTSLTKPTLKADSNTANILTTGKVTDTTSSAVTQGTASPAMTTLMTDTSMTGSHTNARGILTPADTVTPGTASPAMTTLMTDTSMTGSHTNARGILTPAHPVTPGTASPAMTTLMTDTSMTGSHTNARGILTPAHTVTPVGVTLTVSPESVNVILHKEKLILCKVQGGQAEQFYWETPDGEDIEEMRDPRFTVISTEYASKLHIRNAQEKDEGVYVCRAELDSGEEKRARVTITIIQPVSVSNVAPVREFEEGTDAVLSCNVTGIPQPTVTWLHDSRDVTHSVDGRIHKLPDDSLEIRNIMISDAGVYHCVGTVGERNEQKSLKTSVIVKYSPKMLLSNTEVYTWLGNPINISCSVLSVPMATISWNHQNRDLGGVFPMFLMADPPRFTSIIEVRVHTETDWGEYRCQAENSLGRISRSVWVREGDVPSVPEDVHVETNSTSVMVLLVNPASDGHLPLLGYKVEWRLETESEWTSMITSSEFVHIPGLRPHSLYYFRTAALNGRGQGEYSPTISVRTLSEPGSATSKWILIIIVCALIVLLLLLCFCMIKKS